MQSFNLNSSYWNSLADYLRDPALGLNRFRCQLHTFLFAQCVEFVREIMSMHYINLLFTGAGVNAALHDLWPVDGMTLSSAEPLLGSLGQ